MIGEDALRFARKYAVKNAYDYGEAQLSSVLNKTISAFPALKKDIRELAKGIGAVIAEVNAMDDLQVKEEYERYRQEFELEQRGKEEKGKPKLVLDGAVEGEVVTRFAPEPSGYMHVGHASAAFLAREIADAYRGRCFLYFDDTNPEKEKQEYVDAFKHDLDWLGIRFDREYYASDNIEKMYGYARQLMKDGRAYVCTCPGDTIKKNRFEGNPCAHRDADAGTNLSLFERMLNGGFGEGEAVVRFMGDMASENTAMRDPTLFRIKKVRHYRQGDKYVVWPGYDFNTPINDSIEGVTDAMRTKEYELRGVLYDRVLDSLGLRKPRMHLHARLPIKGQPRQKREVRKLVSEGIVSGWDDPRLTTITALRRRGIMPEAIREFVLSVGASMNESVMSIDRLLANNKRVIDTIAKHLFFVHDPVRLALKDAQRLSAKLRLYHDKDEFREYGTDGTFYISGEDAAAIAAGDTVRLKDFLDVRIVSAGKNGMTAEKAEPAEHSRIIQWVPDNDFLECSVAIPGELVDDDGNVLPDSLRTANGYVEGYAAKLALHDIVQFERFGYCILDSKDGKALRFIFISK